MLYPHKFDHDKHIYHCEGEYTLSVSDVISLNGLSDFGQVPSGNLVHAGHRGTALHLAVEAYESGESPEAAARAYEAQSGGKKLWEEVSERLEGYFRFRKQHDVRMVGQMEKSRVFRHAGTEQLIGTTIDMTAFVDNVLTVVDLKTCHKQYGEKARQLKLKWLVQTQAYVEALEEDDEFWKSLLLKPRTAAKAVLHLHPDCGKVRGQEASGFEYHPFVEDAQFLLDSLIRVARCKIASGYRLPSKVPPVETIFSKSGEGYSF